MKDEPKILSYAGKSTPDDSRRARRLIALGIILFVLALLFYFWWLDRQFVIPDPIR